MKEVKKLRLWKYLVITGGLLLLILTILYYTGFIKENCEENAQCFNQKLASCDPAIIQVNRNNNFYTIATTLPAQYEIQGICTLTIELTKMSPASPEELITLLEGKSMTCKLSHAQLTNADIDKMEDLFPYCTGPLKESLYELIIQRMYSEVLSQFSSIEEQVKKTLKSV